MPKPEKSIKQKKSPQKKISKTVSEGAQSKKTKQSATKSKKIMNPHNSVTDTKYEDIHFVDSTKTVWNYS